MVVIGISGKKQSGKDAVLQCIKNRFPEGKVVRVAFADALKIEIAKACGITLEYLDQHKDNFRLILQGWGTDYKRKLVSDTYWLEQWLKEVRKLPVDSIVVAPDVRFLNEASLIDKIGGYLLRISRCTESEDTHSSECELDDYRRWDRVISNTGTLSNLQVDVDITLEMLGIIKQGQ